jgi:hypothetical protein
MSSLAGPFFPFRDWAGRIITFSDAPGDSWKLGEKVSEKVNQKEEHQWHNKSRVSEAWANFACFNELDGRPAIMKIRIQ